MIFRRWPCIFLLGLAAGCRPARPPSIVWIVIDTLRADHLEWYGYPRTTTPGLRPLVDHGVLFENAYTTRTETTPAIASMFTGLYPARHGLGELYVLLPDENRTVAEQLSAVGYDTAAFVSSFVMVHDFSNLAQGFSIYDDFVTDRELYRDNYERKARATLESARRWLVERTSDRPFFLFIHLIDPHAPYAPPGAFAERFHSRESIPVTGDIPQAQRIPGVSDLNRYIDLYDGEIAYASAALEPFFDLLRERHLFDPSLILFTADHGESMGEHGVYFAHGEDVFQPTLHVPLIIKSPLGYGPQGLRVADPVSVVDLLPTVLELAHAAVPEVDGRTLSPLLRGGRLAPRDIFATAGHDSTHFDALVEGSRKTVLELAAGGNESERTYELSSDPTERLGSC